MVLGLLWSAAPALGQGAGEIEAKGRFTNGRGTCQYGPHYTDDYLFTFGDDSGEGVISVHIFQPSTKDEADGTLNSDGDIYIRSSREVYEGSVDGSQMVAEYTFIDLENGCRHTWDAAFTFASSPPVPEEVAVIEETPTPEPVETSEPPTEDMSHTPGVAMEETSDDDESSTNPIGWGLLALGLIGVIAWLLLRRSGPSPVTAGGSPQPPKRERAKPEPLREKPSRDKPVKDKRDKKERQTSPAVLEDIKRERQRPGQGADRPRTDRPQPAPAGIEVRLRMPP